MSLLLKTDNDSACTMYPGRLVPFPHNANKEWMFVTITNRSFQVKFIVVVSSCTRTIGKHKEIWEREVINTKILSYNIEPGIEILSAFLVFAILVSYNGVRNSFRLVSVLKLAVKLFVEPFLEP